MPSDQLQRYADVFRQSQERAHRLADPLSDDAFNWKPSAKAWSVGECLAHLNAMAERYVPVLAEAAAQEGPRGTGPFRYGWASRLFIRTMRPGGWSMPTAPNMAPPETTAAHSQIDKARALADFDGFADRFVAICAQAEGLDLTRIKVRSPFLPILRLPLGAWLDALGQHALRHAGQAERVAARKGFPAGP